MARSRHIDPQTGEYTVARGAPTEDSTVASEVVLAIRSRRGAAGAEPAYGSRLHTIRKLTPASRRLAQAYAREAIQHLIDRGEVRDPVFAVEIDESTHALLVTVAYTNRASRRETVPVTVSID